MMSTATFVNTASGSSNTFDVALIAREEALDALDPLRHLMHAAEDDDPEDTATSSLLPAQRPSIHNENLELSFSNPSQPDEPVVIRLAVDASPGCGGIAWPAGEVLANYLVRQGMDSLQDKHVLELGSGTGLVGLAAAKLGARVWITDQAPLLAIMSGNVLLNNLSTTVSVSELNWGSPIPSDLPPFDVILAADCVYYEPAFPLLVQTLSDLVYAKTEILFCYKKRRKADKRFFTLLRKKFTWAEVQDDPYRAEYARDAITLLKLSKIDIPLL